MIPGRFPSPMPSRETTPIDIFSPSSEILDVGRYSAQAGAQSRPTSLDFTAADQFRKRPRFTDVQSEPQIRLSASSGHHPGDKTSHLASPSPIIRPARDRRRVSDPLHNRMRSPVHGDPNAIRKPRQKRQRLSDSSQYNTHTAPSLRYNAALQPPSTPTQNAVPSSEPHQAAYAHSPSEAPIDREENPRSEPESNSSEHPEHSSTQEETRPRSLVTPRAVRYTHDRLRSKLLEPLAPRETRSGVLYILRDPLRPLLGYKIGSTTRADYEKRIGEHRRDCKFEPHVVYVSECEIEYCMRTEKLVQIDLEDHVRHWQCDMHGTINASPKTSTTHEEWFIVSEALARHTVEKWETFMRTGKPYGWTRTIKPVWSHVLAKRRLAFGGAGVRTHDARREWWTSILAPPATVDYVETYWRMLNNRMIRLYETVAYTWLYFYAFFWQLTTLVYGMVMLSVFRSTMAFAAFAVVLVCASFSVLSRLKLSPPKRHSRRLS